MNRALVFGGLGVVGAALLSFFLRLFEGRFLNDNVNLLIILGVLGLFLVALGLFWRGGKSLMYLGGGVVVAGLLSFLVRLSKFEDNLTLFVLFLVVGLAVLVWGIVKRGR
jgi:hypothetical protein